jgi:hypothetical protein
MQVRSEGFIRGQVPRALYHTLYLPFIIIGAKGWRVRYVLNSISLKLVGHSLEEENLRDDVSRS